MAQGHFAEVRAVLAAVRRRWMAVRGLHAVARLLVGVCVGLLTLFFIELLLTPPDVPMLGVAAGALIATVVFAVRLLRPLGERPSDRRVARLVEERCPELEDRVASAAALDTTDDATPFQGLVVGDAAEQLRGLDLARVVSAVQVRQAVLRGVLAMAVVVALIVVGLGPLGRVARTAWLYAWPFGVTLEVEPGDVSVMAGQPLRVRARLTGTRGAPARTPPTLIVRDGPVPRMVTMRTDADGYVAEFPSVTGSFVYQVSAATLTSRDYRVQALVTPRVRRIDVEYAYPAFTGLAPRREEDGGDIFAPAGTEVRLVVHADKPLAAGTLVLSDGRRIALDGVADGALTAMLLVEADASYRVAVTDTDGLSNAGDAAYFIRATSDRPPTVAVLRPGGDRDITPLEEVTIEARADDDYRVDALELVVTVAGQGEQVLALDAPVPAATVTGRHTLYAENLGLSPGDFISYYARARDVGRAGFATQARSDIYFLEVRSFRNEFEEVQAQAGTGRDAEDIGNLAAIQKEIIVATWRLEPESRTEAVAKDIQAVAAAQGELRAAAARATRQLQGAAGAAAPGRASGNQDPANQANLANLAMTRAVEAMTAAQRSLEALDPTASIPHEMEALNHLLTAQAAIVRRQVARQQSSGGQGGGNQAQEDLSALFDRELRREQETNYETGTSPADGAAGDDGESQAIRRLRELAERQAEVNRELADRVEDEPDDELRRTLARLTREQQQLREQLEALASALDRAQGAPGQARGQASGRQDAAGARARGAQALEALESLERRLRGASGEPRASALGELQLDAQQLADAQRRMADEVRQVEADNRSPASRLRLADEKDDLAARVDTLDRALADLAELDEPGELTAPDRGEDTPTPDDALIRAARDALDQEAIGERMRAGAETLRRSVDAASRSGTTPEMDGLADEDVALADTLARVAEQLRRAGGRNGAADAQTGQMAAAQELRRSLVQLREALERQASQAGSTGPGASGSDRADSRARDFELDELRRGIVDGLGQSPGLLDALRRENPDLARDLEAWAQHWQSSSAPGTEAYKLDLAHWDSLRRNLENGLQQVEIERSRELAADARRDRPSAGPGETLPERYRDLVDEYYRSLATVPETP